MKSQPREIKFRAWTGEEMVYDWVTFRYVESQSLRDFTLEHRYQWSANGATAREVMQYTGLHDKNGVEVFEGDILEHMVNFGPGGDHGGYRTAIELSGLGVNVQHWVFERENYSPAGYTNAGPEVIGNIYENPELIDEKPTE